VQAIPAGTASEAQDWQHAPVPQEPLAGEKLVCILSISRIAVSDYFVQASRRGFVKKIGTNMAQSILSNRYLGAGVKQPPDEAFDLLLCAKDDVFMLVSSQGFVASVNLTQLPFSVVEAIRLEPYDYIMAAFLAAPNRSLVVMTQTGKIVHRTAEGLEAASPQKRKGISLYSQSRRSAGVRVVGAAAVKENDRAISLHSDGSLFLHRIETIVNTGAIEPHGSVLAFTASEF
jgi:DNA gyrase/topoisomerase IV subunit A